MVTTHSPYRIAGRTPREWLSGLPAMVILLITIFLASGEIIHSQLLKVGQATWEEYYRLRTVQNEPTCTLHQDLDGEVLRRAAQQRSEMVDDPLAALLGGDVDEGAIRVSLERSNAVCQERWESYERTQSRVTPGVKAYRAFETTVAFAIAELGGYKRLLLCALLLICAATTTLTRHHIALRPMKSRHDYIVATVVQLVANAMLTTSALVYREQELKAMADGIIVNHFYLHAVWIAGFGALTLINLYQLTRMPRDLEPGGNWLKALLTVPLYSYMCLSAGGQFMLAGYWHGLSVYLGMMMELSNLFLNLALYIWIGMMVKQTRLAQLVFNVFRPFNLSPELLCTVILMVTVLPTAYTGASGIFVIAAGAIIYNELRHSGARPQLALATTAMSGSMGVVIRPCLLVVIIAALNNAVTTAELYQSGVKLFFFTLILFFLFSQLYRREPSRIAPFSKALPQSGKLLLPLIPYVIVMGAVILFFHVVLDRKLDELSAPIILPVVMLAVLLYEFVFVGKARREEHVREAEATGHVRARSLEQALRNATNETTVHIGALLILMAMSVSVGGIVERTGLMEALPATLPNVWVTAGILVLVLVGIGMVMDPYGAVILVNATIAQVAFKNGIDPLHFWMMTLIAFELGYLSPPVALNHLLTRQVVGDQEVARAMQREPWQNFWYRWERYILPCAVMLVALICVAFLPLMSETLHAWLFKKIAVGAVVPIPLE